MVYVSRLMPILHKAHQNYTAQARKANDKTPKIHFLASPSIVQILRSRPYIMQIVLYKENNIRTMSVLHQNDYDAV